jgi:hypothetical protein
MKRESPRQEARDSWNEQTRPIMRHDLKAIALSNPQVVPSCVGSRRSGQSLAFGVRTEVVSRRAIKPRYREIIKEDLVDVPSGNAASCRGYTSTSM